MPEEPAWSELEVTAVRGQSVLTRSRSVQPLKLLNPRTHGAGCQVVLSSYGGGFLAGDVVRLRLHVQAQARLLLSTQANTRVYRTDHAVSAEQHLEAHLAPGSLTAILPDPLVLQARARFRQYQHWYLQPGAVLLLADWLHSGRMDSGEQFEFHSYESEIRLTYGGRLLALDRFGFRPREHIATSPAHFGSHQTTLSVYLAGEPADARFQQLSAVLAAQQPHSRRQLPPDLSQQPAVITFTEARPSLHLLRAVGHSRAALQPLYDALHDALASPELLGFHAGRRKY
ncbi:urease accessory protein UreD [Hymenobacter metallilatus]|uniref:Urease accessory protein UreD n=1 Tax=Hymenobacter metallilatus TaxID=2493666 RepID=A0A428JIB0_9BACT|nr:urease accessory protein UreD [Hymenobacter metallilatus]RSK32421.1 urease accessory protein UreD [Hymenobacter metallilatus]